MGFVTKEQLERARQIPVLDYVMLYESDQFKRVGSSCFKYFITHPQGFFIGSHALPILQYLQDL